MNCPRAVIFDLDGTLAWSKQAVTPEMGEHLAHLLHHTKAAVMSGGSYTQFQKQLLPAFPPHTVMENFFLFPTNAAQCWQYESGEWVLRYDTSFSKEESAHVMSVLLQALKETGMDTPSYRLWGERIEDRGPQITFSGLGQEAPLEEKKKWDPDFTLRTPLAALLRERLPEFAIGVNATTSIDITRKGITKAYGVQEFAKILDCEPANMLYIGDALFLGGNDSVVIPTGVQTFSVENPHQTAQKIEEIIAQCSVV
ncbi:HAD-IIB family hydrolase [bacterium]|nr:HAD-IIB family hydrolase [bacterium]